MVCLDTSIIIEFIRGDKLAMDLIKEYASNEEVCSTTITEYELRKYHTMVGEGLDLSIIDNITLWPFDKSAAKKAAEIFKDLKEKGKMINENDVLIAAIALSKDDILVTKDKHFNNIGSGRIIVI